MSNVSRSSLKGSPDDGEINPFAPMALKAMMIAVPLALTVILMSGLDYVISFVRGLSRRRRQIPLLELFGPVSCQPVDRVLV